MPWLHRLACLRDDVIFFVYLYQRWLYPEDKKRRNEFGQVGEEDGGEDEEDDEEDEDEDETGGAQAEKKTFKAVKGEESKSDGQSGVRQRNTVAGSKIEPVLEDAPKKKDEVKKEK
jgi:hypothetical protein